MPRTSHHRRASKRGEGQPRRWPPAADFRDRRPVPSRSADARAHLPALPVADPGTGRHPGKQPRGTGGLLYVVQRGFATKFTTGSLARTDVRGRAPSRKPLGGPAMTRTTGLSPLLERFFVQRPMNQRQASPHTVKSYRDAFRQLLQFAQKRLGRRPSDLQFEQIDAPLVVDFPRRSGSDARRERPQPQPAACGRPLPLQIRGLRVAEPRGPDPEGARHPVKAVQRAGRSAFSRVTRSTPCSRRRTGAPGRGGATTRSF